MKLACVLVLILGCGGGAAKQSPAAEPAKPAPAAAPAVDTAAGEKANEDGKAAMFANKFDVAIASFEKAFAADPKAMYAFNLCVAHYSSGHYGEAKGACKNALAHNPDSTIEGKTYKLLAKIDDEAKAQGISLP